MKSLVYYVNDGIVILYFFDYLEGKNNSSNLAVQINYHHTVVIDL